MIRKFYDGEAAQAVRGGGDAPIKTKIHSGWDWFCPPHFPEESGVHVCVISKSGDHSASVFDLKLKYLEYVLGEDNFRGLKEGEYVPRWLGKIFKHQNHQI